MQKLSTHKHKTQKGGVRRHLLFSDTRMEAMIKGLIFDKDGTLLDYEAFWLPVARHAVHTLLEQNQVQHADAEALLRRIGAYDGIAGVLCYGTYTMITEVLNAGFTETGNDAVFTTEAVAGAFHDSVGCGEIRAACDDIVSVMEDLQKRGMTIALVTSDNRCLTELSLAELGIRDRFDVVYTDDGEHPAKPDPYYLHAFCHAYGFSPEEVLMIGDTMTDMCFAENGGVRAVGVAKREAEAAILSPKAYTVLPDISHVPALLDRLNG